MNTSAKGHAGEEEAANFLTSKGYRILARNYRGRGGEIDIIAQYKKTLVFVEVKARAYEAFGGPLLAVTPAKQHKVALTAAQFLKANAVKFDSIRFDVVCVLPQGITHIEGAFQPARTTY